MEQQMQINYHTRYIETDEAQNVVSAYVASITNERSSIKTQKAKTSKSYARLVLSAFLPAGYPHSVTKDYLQYQIYDSLQAFSSSIAGLLASRAVLEGIGVGDSDASPTAALLLSVLQESMGRIATILFAHRLGKSLEPECKMYRLAADIFNDAAMILDCLSPAFPKFTRVLLLSSSSVLRSLCGVAAGSSKASLSAHFATQGNLGELNAKDSSQETVISLLGMLAGTLVVSHVSTQWATWTAMIFLLGLHLGTNYLAVRAVSMRTLNKQRANIVLSTLIGDQEYGQFTGFNGRCLTPEEVSKQERIFERDGVLRWQGKKALGFCDIGVSFRTILDFFAEKQIAVPDTADITTPKAHPSWLLLTSEDQDYIIWFERSRNKFFIVLKGSATVFSQLQAWTEVLFVAKQRDVGKSSPIESGRSPLSARDDLKKAIKSSLEVMLRNAGWDLETGALETCSGTRIWEDDKFDSKKEL